MVRTRTNRGSGGGDSPSRQGANSSSLKPSKKGRKRQLTEESSSTDGRAGNSSTPPLCPALLLPLSSPSSLPTSGEGGEQGEDLVSSQQHLTFQLVNAHNTGEAPGRSSSSTRVTVAAGGALQVRVPPAGMQDMQPQVGSSLQWQGGEEGAEQGYLTGPGSNALQPQQTPSSPLNYSNNSINNNNNQQYEEEVQGQSLDLVEEQAADLVIYGTRDQQSGGEKDTVLPDDLKQNLECPVCARISLPPIMQCRNGHVTCNPCRLKVQSCPMCREIDIDIRNLFAEKAVTFMSIPCEFRTYGCRVEVQYKEKEAHERVCKFRPFICPYIECDHKLAADAVVLHVSTAHREECRRSDGPEITASMILIGLYFGGDGAWSPRVISCFGRTFFDVALTRDRWLHHWVWLLGEEEEASNYLYEITAFKGNTKYVYGSEVASLRTSDDEIVSEGKCLSISDAIGRRLRDGDKIRYKLKLIRK